MNATLKASYVTHTRGSLENGRDGWGRMGTDGDGWGRMGTDGDGWGRMGTDGDR